MTVRPSELAAMTRAVSGPVGAAHGLPNPFYVDEALFEEERRRVFFSGWAGIGFTSDVPEPGDARPLSFLSQPLLMLRDREGTLRVFFNVCRHRGMTLVAQRGRIQRAIRCPYHSWCYELDGRLRTTPHVGGPGTNRHDAIRREELGLIEVRSHQWLGVVFVNIDGTAPPFEDWAGEVRTRWAEFDRPLHFAPDGAFSLEVACNWKLAVENYCESYHLPWVHPGLNSYSRLEDHYTVVEPGRFSGQGTHVYRPLLSEDGVRFPEFPGLPAHWTHAAEYIALYPNVLLGIHKDHFFAIRLEPVRAGRTIEHIEIYFASEQALGERFDAARAALAANWQEVFEEDVNVVEGMQRGRASPAFSGGVFSPAMEEATHAFHRWVAERLAA